MISLEYEKFQQRVTYSPIEAATEFHKHIDENIATRETVLDELTDDEQYGGVLDTFMGASELAEKLINASDTPKYWTENSYDCASVGIDTESLGSFVLTRFHKDCRDDYEIFIDNDDLTTALAGLSRNHREKDIDRVAVIQDVTDKDFGVVDIAEIEWGFELLMTIALDAKRS